MTTPKTPTPGELARELRIRINSNLAKGNNAQGLMLYCYNNATAIADALAQLEVAQSQINSAREWAAEVLVNQHAAEKQRTLREHLEAIESVRSQLTERERELGEVRMFKNEALEKCSSQRATIEELRAEVQQRRQDAIDAAGELLVEIPEPGTDMARMMLANVMMRRARDEAQERAERAEGLLRRARNFVPSSGAASSLAREIAASLTPRAEVGGGKPVCERCNDTHMMHLADIGRDVMCTACPLPCEGCRDGGRGAYCRSTPCACNCHTTPGDPDASLAPRAETGGESKPLTVDDLEIGKGHMIRWIGPRPTPGDPDNANEEK